nr:MAG: glycosyl transferase [Mycolicibacterium hassiacum]
MRILARVHAYPPHHNSGAEWAAHNLLRALAERGHRVEVWLSHGTGRRDPYELDGVRVFPGVVDPQVFGRQVRTADVVITHLENVRPAAAAARGWGKPLVVLCHNTFPQTFRALVGTTDLVVYNSAWMREAAARWFAASPRAKRPRREIVVRPPVRVQDYAATPGDHITLVNLYKPKGSETFWELAERMPDRRFLGVRGGYGDQDVRELPNVEVIDNVPGDRMRDEVYARTKILLMPSEYESWGRVGVEAMCSGIPVIAHPTPGLRESLGDAGIFVDRFDIAGWEKAIEALDDPDVYKKASAAAKKRARQLDPADDLARWCDAVEALR